MPLRWVFVQSKAKIAVLWLFRYMVVSDWLVLSAVWMGNEFEKWVFTQTYGAQVLLRIMQLSPVRLFAVSQCENNRNRKNYWGAYCWGLTRTHQMLLEMQHSSPQRGRSDESTPSHSPVATFILLGQLQAIHYKWMKATGLQWLSSMGRGYSSKTWVQ